MSDPAGLNVASGRSNPDLALRVASGLVMAAAALGTAWTGGPLFALFWTVVAMLVLREFLSVIGLAGRRLTIGWGVGSACIAAAAVFAESAAGLTVPERGALLAGALAAAASAPSGVRPLAGAAVLYSAVLAVVPIEVRASPAHGLVGIRWMFAVVWGTDVLAYFVGRTIGGPKLWPRVSPKKTWSGFLGGVAGGTALAVLLVHVARFSYGLGWYSETVLVGLSLVAAIVSQGGDLMESALKRHFGVKDASHIIPGHGGVMDRVDSFWAVCVLMALLLHLTAGPG